MVLGIFNLKKQASLDYLDRVARAVRDIPSIVIEYSIDISSIDYDSVIY